MSISTPIKVFLNKKDKKDIKILEGIKAIKSETSDDSINYAFEFYFKDNANRLRIHIAVDFMVLSIMFASDDKERFKWIKNGYNNNYGMSISKGDYIDTQNKVSMFTTEIKNQKTAGFFGKKAPSILTVIQTKKVKEKTIETIILKEEILEQFYQISIPIKDGKDGIVSAIFNNKSLCIYADKLYTEMEIRELPFLSTGFLYLPKE